MGVSDRERKRKQKKGNLGLTGGDQGCQKSNPEADKGAGKGAGKGADRVT